MSKSQNREAPAPLRVRIGIVTKNRPEYLPRCLGSCVAQVYEPKEIVVWDNSDDAAAVRQNVEVARQFPGVRWIRPDVEVPYAVARHRMMSEEGYDLYASIDDDGWFMGRGEVGEAVALFAAQQDLGAVAFDILSPDRPDPVARRAPEPATMFVGCGHMLRRSMVAEAGFYTDFPGPYGAEEKDLCIRLLDRGWRTIFLPGVHVWHDKDARNRDWGAQHRSSALNDMVFGLLRCPLPDVLYYLPGKAVRHARWGLKGSPEERWSGFRGLADFIACAPSWWHKRQPVRRETFREYFASGRRSGRKPRDWEGKER